MYPTGVWSGRVVSMKHLTRLGFAMAWVITWGCAGTAPTRFEGVSGSVTWEVVDIAQYVAADGRAIRWDYTVVLKEMSGTTVTFDRVEAQTKGDARSGLMAGAEVRDFRRRLEANSELRLNESYTVYFTDAAVSRPLENPASRENYTRYLRYSGKSGTGAEVPVLVSFPLNAGIGRKVEPPKMTASLPPPRSLRPDELTTLMGTWIGSYRTEFGIDIPIRVTVNEGGAFEVAEGNPVRNRFTGSLSILGDKVQWYSGADSGPFTFHEGGGQRVLVGRVTGQRGAHGNAPARQVAYTVRLESRASDPSTTVTERSPAPGAASLRADVPRWKPGFEWTYQWESPRGKGTFTRAVLREERLDGVDYYVLASGGRELYWRQSDLAEFMEKVNGAVDVRWTPPRLEFAWPLGVGHQWEQPYVREELQNRRTEDLVRTGSVEAEERVTVPAGTFNTLKIAFRNLRSGALDYEIWYAPEVQNIVRERGYYSYGIRTRELTHFKLE
jgi:hypothetical protein